MEVIFTDRELDLMDVLWDQGPTTVTEVQSALQRLTRKIFKGSPEIALTHMVSATDLTPEQAKRIRALLDEQQKVRDK